MFPAITEKIIKFVVDNSSTILTGVAVVGTIGTAILASKATLTAQEIIAYESEEAEIRDEPPLTRKEKFVHVLPCYIPTLIVGGLTIGAIIGADRIANRRMAALAAAYSLSERAYNEYKDKVVEKIGLGKERAVRDEVAKAQVQKNPYSEHKVIIGEDPQQLFLDAYSGRYFMSSMDVLRRAENELNHHLIHFQYASLSDFYAKIGLASTLLSEEVGWNADRLVELTFTPTISDDDRSCMVVSFQVAPVRSYYKNY